MTYSKYTIPNGGGGFYASQGKYKVVNDDILNRANDIISLRSSKTEDEESQEPEASSSESGGWEWLNTPADAEASVTSNPKYVQNTETTKDISDDLKTLLGLFDKAGIKVRMTSGYREGAKTKQGNVSHHSTGHAMDIVPEDGNFAKLAQSIRDNFEISSFMKSHGLGILDESTAEALAKTGGTGAHFHVGPDNIAQAFWTV